MNFKIIQRIALLLFIFVSSGSFAQYKYDIGLRVSSYELEAFQIEQRFHLDNPYTLTVALATGSRWNSYYSESHVYSDSLVDISSNYSSVRNNALKIGLQRKLGFLATDVFYAGVRMGIGFENHQNRSSSTTLVVHDSLIQYPDHVYGFGEEISSSQNITHQRVVNAQIGLSFGMDVPISKRFSINAELGLAGLYANGFSYSTIRLIGSVSGGLRYQFGKRT
ncbi:MAG: hypothetical protein HRT58_13580 [Crocinitomicaceae bacterium]|nr:hypothetical protein [Flavobacteriales bacterium]NQZ36695.1 hypothetical protein [Crocinitomicaceae bacterium]